MFEYEHKIGVITTFPTLTIVVTENRFLDGQFVEYNYFGLCEAESVEKGKALCSQLNEEYGLPRRFNSKESENFLVSLADRYPESKILLV